MDEVAPWTGAPAGTGVRGPYWKAGSWSTLPFSLGAGLCCGFPADMAAKGTADARYRAPMFAMPTRHAAWICLAALAACQTAATKAAPPGKRLPNIVILYADDLGYGDLGTYALDSKIPTPNLDRLAAQGLRCLDAHSSSGICTPSRYALLTGRHHWRQFHDIVDSFGPSVFQPGRLTMADMLREHGYRTACIGKWHLGWDWQALQKPDAKQVQKNGKPAGFLASAFDWQKPIPDGPCAHGFDHYFGDDVPNFPPYAWIKNDRVVVPPSVPFTPDPKPDEGTAEGREGPMVAGWRLDAVMPTLTEHAIAWLREQTRQEQPFFLYFPFTSPHAPIVPTAEWKGRSGAGPYGDYVMQTDATVGAVLQTLDELDLADNTIVVFSSDNGPEIFAYDRIQKTGHHSTGELRGLKRDVFEGGHRVPMLVRWPAVIAEGAVTDALIGQVDLMATFAALVGHPLPANAAEDSFDLLPLLRGEQDNVRDFLVHNTYANKWAIRRGDWLLVDSKDGLHRKEPDWQKKAEGYLDNPHPVALYDLRADPGQRNNVSAEHAAIVAELQTLLHRLREQGHSAPRLQRP
jgi:arylsulfatase A